MLPAPHVPEKGSKKIINGKEFVTKHVFTTEAGNILDTVDGDFIYPNGEPVKDKTMLELLPAQHKGRALDWWKKRFGGNDTGESQAQNQQTGPTIQDLLGIIKDLQNKVAILEARDQTLGTKEISKPQGVPIVPNGKKRGPKPKGVENIVEKLNQDNSSGT